MALRDIAAQNASLDNDYGVTRGPNGAASHLLCLYSGDPTLDGVELDGTSCPGYDRVTVDELDWLPADAGAKSTNLMQFPDATAGWALQVTHAALVDAADGITMWDCFRLSETVNVSAAGAGPQLAAIVRYGLVSDAI